MKSSKRSESMKKYWSSLTPEERRSRSANWQKAGVEAAKTPAVRARQSELAKERWADPEYKARHSAGIKKAWDESSPERREKASQRSSNLSDETRQKRSEGLRRAWAERSEEYRKEIADKIRQNWRDKSEEEKQAFSEMMSKKQKKYLSTLTRQQIRERNKNALAAMHASMGTDKPTSIEIAVQQALDNLGIEYDVHKVIDNLTVDLYIPRSNLVVECDGDYWHNLPGQKHADMRRDYWLRSQGFKVVRIREKAIKENVMVATRIALRLTEA